MSRVYFHMSNRFKIDTRARIFTLHFLRNLILLKNDYPIMFAQGLKLRTEILLDLLKTSSRELTDGSRTAATSKMEHFVIIVNWNWSLKIFLNPELF